MSSIGIPVSFSVQIPKELQADDFDSKIIKSALRDVGKSIQKTAKKKLSNQIGRAHV